LKTPKTNILSITAIIFGSLLIVLETYRRFGQWDEWINIIDDYLGGGFLIFAAIKFKVSPGKYKSLLLTAWAILVGGFFYSIAGSIKTIQTTTVETTGMPALPVLLIKIALFLIVITNLIFCIKLETDGNEEH